MGMISTIAYSHVYNEYSFLQSEYMTHYQEVSFLFKSDDILKSSAIPDY